MRSAIEKILKRLRARLSRPGQRRAIAARARAVNPARLTGVNGRFAPPRAGGAERGSDVGVLTTRCRAERGARAAGAAKAPRRLLTQATLLRPKRNSRALNALRVAAVAPLSAARAAA